MSLFDSFDKDGEEIISPKSFFTQSQDIPERVLAFFSQKYLNKLLDMYDCKEIAHLSAGARINVYSFDYKGETIAFYLSPIGGCVSTGILEEICAGTKIKTLFFGSCGSLDRNISAGHMMIPVSAYRDEGTSYHYAEPSDYIEVASAERLAEVFDELEVPYNKIKVWTTDAFYRETRRNMQARRSEGCVAVDMECASLMACAQFRGYETYEFLYAADCLDGEEWDRRILGGTMSDMFDKILHTALETLIRL